MESEWPRCQVISIFSFPAFLQPPKAWGRISSKVPCKHRQSGKRSCAGERRILQEHSGSWFLSVFTPLCLALLSENSHVKQTKTFLRNRCCFM